MPDFALVSSKYEDALASANSAAASRAQILLDRTRPVCRTRGSPLVRALADLRSTQLNRRMHRDPSGTWRRDSGIHRSASLLTQLRPPAPRRSAAADRPRGRAPSYVPPAFTISPADHGVSDAVTLPRRPVPCGRYSRPHDQSPVDRVTVQSEQARDQRVDDSGRREELVRHAPREHLRALTAEILGQEARARNARHRRYSEQMLQAGPCFAVAELAHDCKAAHERPYASVVITKRVVVRTVSREQSQAPRRG